jgi:hypothetical protein
MRDKPGGQFGLIGSGESTFVGKIDDNTSSNRATA